MKRLSTIIMALALVLGMSQCKKQETPTNGNGGEKVHITLNVDNSESLAVNVNDNGSRHDMSPRLGMVKFENGDVLHVGYNGEYFGQLTYQNGAFSGDLDEPAQNVQKPLHFYFLGGKGIDENSPAVGDDSFTFSIADQSTKLPVLCYGASNQNYGESSNYTATLEYKCALVRFDLENHVENNNVTLSGVPTQATVNFANPTATTAIVAAANQTNVNMTLYGEPGNAAYRWAILLKDTNLDNAQGLTIGSTVTNHVMDNNNYINGGISINNPRPVTLPNADLVIKKSNNDFSEFTVSSTGKKVYFSKANLTWNPTYGYHFHDNQFNEEHSGGSSVLNFDYSNLPAPGDQQQTNLTGLDRFTWGHIPNQSINSSYYITNQQLSAGLNPEWGKQMTGEGNDQWRTLTVDEWNYLLHHRSGNRFMLVSVLVPCTYRDEPAAMNIQGLLLFPDNFDYSGLGLTQAANANSNGFSPSRINRVYAGAGDYNPASGNYTPVYDGIVNAYPSYNVYKLIEPTSSLEYLYSNSSSNMYKLLQAGCVFLPAVGCREGAAYKKYLYYQNRNNPAQGFYWAADRVIVGEQENAKYFWFGYPGGGAVETNPCPTFEANNTQHRSLGCCVRLVWDAN